MIFGQNRPMSEYADEPDILMDPRKQALMKVLGFNPNGTPTTWGKLAGWIPGVGIATNVAANQVAKKNGAFDTLANSRQMLDNNLNKLKTQAGVGLGVAGAISGNPELIGQGVGQLTEGIGGLTGDRNNYSIGGQSYFF